MIGIYNNSHLKLIKVTDFIFIQFSTLSKNISKTRLNSISNVCNKQKTFHQTQLTFHFNKKISMNETTHANFIGTKNSGVCIINWPLNRQ
jgi:hypothetical protein